MKRYHYQATVDLADQDDDLRYKVPDIIRDRFEGTAVHVVFIGGPLEDDDPEGGVSVPAGDSPDSPPAGESRLPGGSDDYLPSENRPDDSAGIGHVIPLVKNSQFSLVGG